MEIRLLDKATIDKIAAGEVVERPVNVIKELMENSIDSGADAISVEIRDGGKTMMRVTDNGCGIPKDQIRSAFLRHATSKIRSAQDLSFVTTLGFRGEALSSISAVSETELCTKTKDSVTGTIYKISGGVELSMEDAGLPDGTTIIIYNIFKNVPARLKFLSSTQTEGNNITEVVEKIAMSHPDVAIKFTNNGSLRLNTSGNGSLKDVIYAVYGREMTSNLLEVHYKGEFLSIDGFIGKPEIQRSNRAYENFFVNGRYVKDKILSAAVESAYKGYQMKGSYPFNVLNITIEPELMDVNVHPAKREIRFFNNEMVYNCISSVISDVIKNRENIPAFVVGKDEKKSEQGENTKKEIPEPFEMKRKSVLNDQVNENVSITNIPNPTYPQFISLEDDGNKAEDGNKYKSVRLDAEKVYSGNSDIQPQKETSEGTVYTQQTFFDEKFLGEKARLEHKIIGEIFDTYWIMEYDDKMFIIDQHAAHEKVNYERFMRTINSGNFTSQYIKPGMVVTLSASEETCLLKYMDDFIKLGFEIEHFGKSDYIISAVPSDIYGINSEGLFISFLDELCETVGKTQGSEMLMDRIATAACKASVKGGDRLSLEEANKLIDELLSLDNPYNCPHGRPTIITMSRYEMEKKFKRII